MALLIAMIGDAIQIFGLPLFAAGGLSPADTLLDAVMAVILIRMLGWHWAFLPTLVAEMTPGFDLFPTVERSGSVRDAAEWILRRSRDSSSRPGSRASDLVVWKAQAEL